MYKYVNIPIKNIALNAHICYDTCRDVTPWDRGPLTRGACQASYLL